LHVETEHVISNRQSNPRFVIYLINKGFLFIYYYYLVLTKGLPCLMQLYPTECGIVCRL